MELQPATCTYGLGQEAGQIAAGLACWRRGRLGKAGAEGLHLPGDEALQPALLAGRQRRYQGSQLGRRIGRRKFEFAGDFLMHAGREKQAELLARTAAGARRGSSRVQMLVDGESAPDERPQRGPGRCGG